MEAASMVVTPIRGISRTTEVTNIAPMAPPRNRYHGTDFISAMDGSEVRNIILRRIRITVPTRKLVRDACNGCFKKEESWVLILP
jgi:hypothetical protein